MSNTDSTPEFTDPVIILKERLRLKKEDEERQKLADAAQALLEGEELEAKQPLVPALVDQLLSDAAVLYALYLEVDRPNLTEARLVSVIDHEAEAAQQATKPSPKWRSWLRRLIPPPASSVRADLAEYLLNRPTTQKACWEATWINLSGSRPFVYMYLEVETGQLYCNSFTGGYLSGLSVDILDVSQLFSLNYNEMNILLDNMRHKIAHLEAVLRSRRWEAERREHEARAAAADREKHLSTTADSPDSQE